VNVQELVSFAKGDHRYRKIESDATKEPRLVRALGWGVRYVRDLVQIHVDRGIWERNTTLELDASSTYLLGPHVGAIRHIEDSTSRQVIPKLITRDRARFYGDGSDYPTGPTVRYYYVPRWPELIYGTATAGSTTSMTLPLQANLTYGTLETRNDAYIGSKFEIVSGTGLGQVLLVSDFVASTRVLTVGDENGDAVTAPDATSVFSLYLDDIPDEYQPLVIDYALYWLTQDTGVLDRLGIVLDMTLRADVHKERVSPLSSDDHSNTRGIWYIRNGPLLTFFTAP